jgi:hypothetical protein
VSSSGRPLVYRCVVSASPRGRPSWCCCSRHQSPIPCGGWSPGLVWFGGRRSSRRWNVWGRDAGGEAASNSVGQVGLLRPDRPNARWQTRCLQKDPEIFSSMYCRLDFILRYCVAPGRYTTNNRCEIVMCEEIQLD